jgi:predicted AlkP superfamily pyrophosphatase or phosphodiesterase
LIRTPRRTVLRRAPVWALAVLALLAAAAAAAQGGPGLLAAPEPVARHVVVLSLDGARADAVRSAVPASLAARGAVSWTAQTITPSLTLPAHTSMLSGVLPAVHGVMFNDWREGQPYFRRGTVLSEVTRGGSRAVAVVHKPKLLMLAPPGSAAIARYLPYPRFRQAEVVETAARLFVEQRPALLFIHVADPDDAGHTRGWMSAEYVRAIAAAPALIERVLRAFDEAGVFAQALLIVTADHGGHDRTHGTLRPEDMTIPWLAFGGAARQGVTLARRVVVHDTAATALAALGLPLPGDWQGRSVGEALRAP